MVTRLIRRVPFLEQELFIIPGHMSSPPVFIGVHVTPSLVFPHSVLWTIISLFVRFHLAILLSDRLRYSASDYPFVLCILV